jgi:glutamate-1-semialdehyde 2,1-aminomutase
MKFFIFVQARLSSGRMPNKVMKNIGKYTVINLVLKRLMRIKSIKKENIIILTTTNNADDILVNHIKDIGFRFFRGSEDDVLDRYYKAALRYNAKNILRITADCPLIESKVLNNLIKLHFKSKADLTTNVMPPTFPDGLDGEIFTFNALQDAWKNSSSKSEREHVTLYIKSNPDNKISKLVSQNDFSQLRLTLDEQSDLKLIRLIYKKFSPNIFFSYQDIINFYKKNKNIFAINSHIKRDEGMILNFSQKLWKRALEVIPGGNMFFSKRPDIYSKNNWPIYFEKAKGYKIWGLDGKIYKDLSYMGVGTNVLGYGNAAVDRAVLNTIKNGNMSTLNAPQDIYLAEKLIELNPWAEMVKFARTGGEANAVAVRIARASTDKKKIAVCGYHGWHDWYLSSYINKKNNNFFNNKLGIEGVPNNLKNTIFTFEYNDFDAFKKLLDNNSEIGIVKMEVERNIAPKNNFLKKIRDYTKKKNIILIFDECTSGFRETKSGLHLNYKVTPDMVIYGKALGNGYAINAIVGTSDIMESANKSFISSTFWSERIGTTAALATLSEMSRIKSWDIIKKLGLSVKKNLEKISKESKLDFLVYGLDSMPSFKLKGDLHKVFKTYVTEEMIKINFLAIDSIYLSIPHNNKILLDDYFEQLRKICINFKIKSESRQYKDFVKSLNVANTTFSRLN